MKMKIKGIAICLVALMLATVFSGCAVQMEATFSEDGSGSVTQTTMFEKEDWGEYITDTDDTVWEEDTVDGVDYLVNTKVITFDSLSDFLKQTEMAEYGSEISLDSNYFILKSAEQTVAESDLDLSGIKDMLQCKYSYTFPYTVIKSNGDIGSDGKTVTWDLTISSDSTMLWAVFSDDLLDSSIAAPKLSGAKNNAYYKKDVTVKASSDTVIASVSVNGTGIGSDICTVTTEGKNTVIYTDVNGKTSKLTFTIDKTKPTVKGVANGKTYTKAKTIKFSDKYGVKSATLNGKTIKSGKKVSKKGSYKLVVTDKAGNKTTVKFKIKK